MFARDVVPLCKVLTRVRMFHANMAVLAQRLPLRPTHTRASVLPSMRDRCARNVSYNNNVIQALIIISNYFTFLHVGQHDILLYPINSTNPRQRCC